MPVTCQFHRSSRLSLNFLVIVFKEKFQVVFTINVRDIFIPVTLFIKENSCSRSAIAMYGAFVIPVGFWS